MLFELIQKSYRIYRPYFGLKGKKLLHTLYALSILIGNISLAFFICFINAAFDSLMASIVPGVSYRAFFASTGYFLFVVLAYAGIASINNWLASHLATSVSDEYNQNIVSRWLTSNAYFGSKFIPAKKDAPTNINPAQIIAHDSSEITTNVSFLSNNFLMSTSSFVVGLIGLVTLSGPLSFPLMGYMISIPHYLAVSSILYALFFNLISNWVGSQLRAQQSTKKKAGDTLHNHLHHVTTHAESIAFSKGAKKELSGLINIIKAHHLSSIFLNHLQSALAFLNSLHEQMASIFGIIISAPNVIGGHMGISGVFQVSAHFDSVVRWFTWRNENLEQISSTLVALERLQAFEEVLNEWEKLKPNHSSHNTLRVSQQGASSQPLIFTDIQINAPSGNKMIGPITLNFPQGSITLIQGDSGIGKTSLFRAIAGLWPFGQGEITLPKNITGVDAHILFIPQKPYFPYQKTLLEAIIYPLDAAKHPISKEDIDQIKTWMKTLGFKLETIEQLEKVQEWEKILSGGEQQRIAIISALHKKPDFLFMDEGTSAIDKNNKKIAEDLFKHCLPHTTIAYIDHNPSPDFHSHTIKL